jgi:hypothetical protein
MSNRHRSFSYLMLNPSVGGPFSHFRGRARCFPYVSIDDMASDKHSAGVLVNLFQPERDIPSKVLTALVLEKKRRNPRRQ